MTNGEVHFFLLLNDSGRYILALNKTFTSAKESLLELDVLLRISSRSLGPFSNAISRSISTPFCLVWDAYRDAQSACN